MLSLGLGIHLAVDNLQRKRVLFYFLAYRIVKKFDAAFLLPEDNLYSQGALLIHQDPAL